MFSKIAMPRSMEDSKKKAMRGHGHIFASECRELSDRCVRHQVNGLPILVAVASNDSEIYRREASTNKELYYRKKNQDKGATSPLYERSSPWDDCDADNGRNDTSYEEVCNDRQAGFGPCHTRLRADGIYQWVACCGIALKCFEAAMFDTEKSAVDTDQRDHYSRRAVIAPNHFAHPELMGWMSEVISSLLVGTMNSTDYMSPPMLPESQLRLLGNLDCR